MLSLERPPWSSTATCCSKGPASGRPWTLAAVEGSLEVSCAYMRIILQPLLPEAQSVGAFMSGQRTHTLLLGLVKQPSRSFELYIQQPQD